MRIFRVDATVDWERNYVNGNLFRSVLGNITSSEEGLPKENLDSYLVRGYNRNDRVGKVILNNDMKMYYTAQKKK